VKRTRRIAWLAYAGVALAVTVVIGVIVGLLRPAETSAILVAAGMAYSLQIAAFALLITWRDEARLFMMALATGIALRAGALFACAYWLSRSSTLPRSTTLLSFVGFVFVMLLMEPLFLRWDLRA
jgi:hypothetical protein